MAEPPRAPSPFHAGAGGRHLGRASPPDSNFELEVIYCVGGVISPLLANIYLHRLDTFIATTLLPAHNRGSRRRPYRPYMRLHRKITHRESNGRVEEARELRKL